MEDVDDGDANLTVVETNNDEDDAEGEADEDAEGEEDVEDTQDNLDESPSQARPAANPPRTPTASAHINGTITDDRDRDTRGHSPQTPQPQYAPAASSAPYDFRPPIRPAALTAASYDICPTIAAPHGTSINAITATPDMRYVFTGGSDGYVRKFNWVDTANGKALLTVAQRHPFVDTVTKAGVILSYWENEDASLNPVYSLCVHHEALYTLSGTESGAINLHSVRIDEGKLITTLSGHTSAVSVMQLSNDEKGLLSGSWDKTVHEWDLMTGKTRASYTGSSSQISAIEARPMGGMPIPREVPTTVPELGLANGTMATNNAASPVKRGSMSLGRRASKVSSAANNMGSPGDSLFGGGGSDNDNNSLFGDDEAAGATDVNGLFGQDDDDDFSRALANGIQEQSQPDEVRDLDMGLMDLEPPPEAPAQPLEQSSTSTQTATSAAANGIADHTSLPHSNDIIPPPPTHAPSPSPLTDTSPDVFLTASIDGTVRLYDRRRPLPIARIPLPHNVPPWCMSASWSPSGNHIYVGRRNNTVDEYSLHKSLQTPSRTLKFPAGSGAVSALRVMPNGRHLLCASHDILRLWDLQAESEVGAGGRGKAPFLIVPGHRTGVVSQLYLDPKCQFLISTGGNRGWEGNTTEALLGYEIGFS